MPISNLTVGIDLRPLRPVASGGIVNSQIGILREVFARHPEHRYIVYCTAESRLLLERFEPGVEAVELPAEHYYWLLGRHLEDLGADLLYRVYPGTEPLQFPPGRQIFYIPDNQHDFLPELFDEAALAYRRQAFAMALSKLQSDILRVLARNRSESSYLAGGLMLNRHWLRRSDDIDICSAKRSR